MARSLKNHFPDGAEDVEDFEQELALRLYVAHAGYDPTRSGRATYAKYVLMTKAASLVTARKAKKRVGPRAATLPVCGQIDNEHDGEAIDISDLMAVEREEERVAELDREVAKAQAKLPRHQRELCEQLKGANLSEAATEMGKSRSWVYEQLDKMRPHFERELRRQEAADTFSSSPVDHRRR